METGHYKTPGALIREAREARGMSIDELATESRISEHMLTALEDDNYAKLNGPLYVKSFLRTCSEFLNLDAELLLRHYELMGKDPEPEVAGDDVWQTEETRVHHVASFTRRGWMGLAAIAVVIILIVLGIRFFGGSRDEAIQNDPADPSITQQSDTTDPVEVEAAPEIEAPVKEATPERRSSDTRQLAQSDTPSVNTVVQPDQRILDSLSSLPAGDRGLVFEGNRSWPLVLRLVFSQQTDYAIAADQQQDTEPVDWPETVIHGVPEEEIVPGRLYTIGSSHIVYWGANDHFLLKLQAAEGVTVTLNGRVLPIPTRIVGREWVLDGTLVGR